MILIIHTSNATTDDDEVEYTVGLGVEGGVGGACTGVCDGAMGAQHEVYKRHEQRDVGGGCTAGLRQVRRVRKVTISTRSCHA